jgi:hypothetical protein
MENHKEGSNIDKDIENNDTKGPEPKEKTTWSCLSIIWIGQTKQSQTWVPSLEKASKFGEYHEGTVYTGQRNQQ